MVRKWIERIFSPARQSEKSSPTLQHNAVRSSLTEKDQGDAFMRGGDFTAAADCYRRALELNPNNAKAHNNLGFVQKELGQLTDAERCFTFALSIDPTIADAHYGLGVVCQSAGQFEAALKHFFQALELASDFESAYLDACLLLILQGRTVEATQLMQNGIRQNPTYANLHFYLANIYNELEQLDLAIASFRQALSIQPDHAQALGNLGIVLLKKRDAKAAIEAFQMALALDRNYVDAHNNLGNALLQFNRFDEAMASYRNGLEIDPGSERLIYNRGLLSLLLGDFESGWEDYEYRWYQTEQTARRDFHQPLWQNDAEISGRKILLHAEQGIGDALQFCRYVERVVALGAIVYLEVHPQIKSLLQLMPGVAAVVAMGEALPDFDYHCPFASLPLAFHTSLATIPAKIPYLNAPIERVQHWENYFHGYRFPRIGIVWSGGTMLKNDHNRSMKLEAFSQVVKNGEYRFFSLQKDVRAVDAPQLEKLPELNHLGPQLTDFVETAAAIANLDLVISVDTSVAHLAGALGKPVWILLPFSPDFRWLLDRADSPWYPSARLFRQSSIGDWNGVMQELQVALNVQSGKFSLKTLT